MKAAALILALVVLPGFASAGTAQEETLHLRAEVLCHGPELVLADAFEEGLAAPFAGKRLAKSPRPGAGKTISRHRIQRMLWDWGWRGRILGAEVLHVRTPLVVLDASPLFGDVAACLDGLLAEEGLHRDGEIRGWNERIELADSRLKWNLRLQGSSGFRDRSATLKIEDGLGFSKSMVLRFRCTMPVRVAVADETLDAGQELAAWRFEERDMIGMEGRPLEEAALPGAVARCRLREGDVLTDRLLSTGLMVRAGREVSIEVNRGAVRVSLAGIAQSDAGLGETVAVRHRDSRLLKRYRVAGPGRVVPVWMNEGELDS